MLTSTSQSHPAPASSPRLGLIVQGTSLKRRERPSAIKRPSSPPLIQPLNKPWENFDCKNARRRPKHGEHRWMRQIATTDITDHSDEDLLYNLLGMSQTTLSPSFLAISPPTQLRQNRLRHRQHYSMTTPTSELPTLNYDYNNETPPIITVTDPENPTPSIIFSPDSEEPSSPVLSLPELLHKEHHLPPLTPTSRYNHDTQSSIPKLPRIPSAERTYLKNYTHHRRSRSYSDPLFSGLLYKNF